jgi:hypothetical protein
MNVSIKRVRNGCYLEVSDGGIYVYQGIEDNEEDAWVEFQDIVLENYGPPDMGKYAEKRIYNRVRHGADYKCPNKPCRYCLDKDW